MYAFVWLLLVVSVVAAPKSGRGNRGDASRDPRRGGGGGRGRGSRNDASAAPATPPRLVPTSSIGIDDQANVRSSFEELMSVGTLMGE